MAKKASRIRPGRPTEQIIRQEKVVQQGVVARTVGINLPEVLSRRVTSSASGDLAELIANAWDADATETRLDYIPLEDRLVISDNGAGMNPEELRDFYRLGDSRKLQRTTTERGRRPLGSFGVATIVLKALAHGYTLSTCKDGLETVVEEEFTDSNLELDAPLNFVVRKTTGRSSGTRITLRGLKFKDGDGFSMIGLKGRIQTQFRKLMSLKDKFSVYINGEELRPTVIDNADKFSIDDSGLKVGRVTGMAYLAPKGTSLAGVHVSVGGRIYGDPRTILNRLTQNNSLQSRLIVDVEADSLKDAVLIDRGVFREDTAQYQELIGILKRVVMDVRNFDDETKAVGKAVGLLSKNKKQTHTVVRRLARIVPEIDHKTSIEIGTNSSGARCEYDYRGNRLVVDERHLNPSMYDQKSYEALLNTAIVEAIAVHRLRGKGSDSIEEFMKLRERILSKGEEAKASPVIQRVHARRLYSPSELARTTQTNLAGLKYMMNNGMFPQNDGLITGEDFTRVMRRTSGLVPLNLFVEQVFENDIQYSRERLTELFQRLGESVHPFAIRLGLGDGCYFVESVSADSFAEKVVRDPEFKRGGAGDIKGVVSRYAERYLSPDKLVAECNGLTRGDVEKTIVYAQDSDLDIRSKKVDGQDSYHFRDVVSAVQTRRWE